MVNPDSYPCTKVVCIKRKNNKIIQDCDIYIGRQVPKGWNLSKSIFANPYKIDTSFEDKSAGKTIYVNTIEDTMILYWNMLVRGKSTLKTDSEINFIRKALPHLKGKILGCFCKKEGHEICHGDILAYLCDNWDGDLNEDGTMVLRIDVEKMSEPLRKLIEKYG